MKNLANKITLVRIAMIPVFMYLAYTDRRYGAVGVFIVACLTDFLDGYVARHYNQVSNFGKFMDPLADKMLVVAAMCYLTDRQQIPGLIVAVVLFREFAVSGLRLIAVERQLVIAARVSGKIKTSFTMVALAAMVHFPEINIINIIGSYGILVFTVLSGVDYFIANGHVISDLSDN